MMYDVVECDWDSILVEEILLQAVSQKYAELYTFTHISSKQGKFLSIKPHGKFQVGETACEFTPENDRCNIRPEENLW